MTRLTLLHTNDLHGHLSADAAHRLARLKAELAPCLLFDSGDAVTCGNVGWPARGERLHGLMATAGYDALAMGNREYHFRPGPQTAKLRLAPAPVLCANLRPEGWGGSQASVRFTLPGLPPLLVFGLLTPMVTEAMWARRLTPSRFDEPEPAARRQLDEAGDAVVVALTHLGERTDRRLAGACPQLPLILGGHSHTPMVEQVGGTLICQNEPHGGSVMRVTLDFDGARLAAASAEPLALETGRTP